MVGLRWPGPVALLVLALILSGCSSPSSPATVETSTSGTTSLLSDAELPADDSKSVPAGTTNETLAPTNGTEEALENATAPTPLAIVVPASFAGMAYQAIPVSANATGGSGSYACTWSAPSGSIADPKKCSTTFTAPDVGETTLTVTLTDGTETAQASPVVKAGKPAADGSLTCAVYAYNTGGLGLSNILGTVRSTAGLGYAPYAAGMDVTVSARTCDGSLSSSAPAALFFLKADGTFVDGPVSLASAADGNAFRYDATYVIPDVPVGRYLLAIRVTDGGDHWVTSSQQPDADGMKQIDVVA
jgi:hypothetical protein